MKKPRVLFTETDFMITGSCERGMDVLPWMPYFPNLSRSPFGLTRKLPRSTIKLLLGKRTILQKHLKRHIPEGLPCQHDDDLLESNLTYSNWANPRLLKIRNGQPVKWRWDGIHAIIFMGSIFKSGLKHGYLHKYIH